VVWPGAAYPYLTSVTDDVHDGDEPWILDLSMRDIQEALERAGFGGRRLASLEIQARSGSGRVSRLRVEGMVPDVIAGEEFRRALGPNTLRSTAFTISRTDSGVRFVGRGFGHGVGMCVVGAGRRALRGESAAMILAKYYPGLELTGANVATRRVPAPEAPAVTRAGAAGIRGNAGVIVTAPPALAGRREIERIAAAAHAELSRTLGVSVAPITIALHDTIDSFRLDTGQPWWVSAVVSGASVDLAPLPLLEQRDGVTTAVRIAIAELLTVNALAGKPAWVRIGAARFFGRAAPAPPSSATPRCPTDAELALAISATAQRDAEARAEACFARAYQAAGDWRAVR
jgi:hypothetical protein